MNLFKDIKPPDDIKWYRDVTLLAASSAMATFVTHPLDVVRVQMQSQFAYISPRQVLRRIVRYRGILGVYFGLIAAVQREFTYCLLRFAFYEQARSRGKIDNFWKKMLYASASGFFGGLISTPLTKVAIRIRTDAAKPPKRRYNYSHVIHGLRCLYREGGLSNYFNMTKTCAIRGMLMTACQISIYNQVKETLLKQEIEFNQTWQLYLVASAVAGCITVIVVTPMDVVEQIGHTMHAKKFRGEWHIIRHLSCLHGLRGFYRGLLSNVLRIPPQTILTFLIYEKMSSKFPKFS